MRSVNPVHNKAPCQQCHGPISEHPINGLLVIDYDATNIKQKALSSALMLTGIGAVVVLATGLGVWFALNALVVNPLDRLRQTSKSLAAGNLQARAGFDGKDELAELANSFDNMADQLGKSLTAVNESEKFLQHVIDSIPDGVRVIDDDFNIIKANLAYCRQTGNSMKQTLSKKCYQSSHQRSEPCPPTLIECPVVALKEASNETIKARHRHVDGNGAELFVEVSAARVELTHKGKASSYVIESIRDLAEQAKFSQEQRLSELGLLATGVAHEIHNPLSSIVFALKAMQKQSKPQTDRQSRDLDYLEIAEEQVQKCLAVTDRLLMLSLPPDNNDKLVEVGSAVRNTLSLMSYQIEQKRLS